MAFNIDYFLKINNSHGVESNKEIQLYDLKRQVNDRFTDTIDCYQVQINNVRRDLLVIRSAKNNIKSIKSRPNETFNIGDYVTFENNNWLVTEKDECNQAYTSGKIQLTNYTLKFQSSDGTILSYPCITSGKTYDNDENKIITLPSNQKSVLLPYDEYTAALEGGKRLYVDKLNKTAYKIVGSVDNTTYNYGDKGLIYFVAEQCVTKEIDDRPDLGICNYKEPNTTPPVNPINVIITCMNQNFNNNVRLGVTYNFVANAVDQHGEEVPFIQPKFTISDTYGGKVILTDSGNGTCSLKVGTISNVELCAKKLTLSCMNMVSGHSSSVVVTIVGLI